jgi:hypothetical protein
MKSKRRQWYLLATFGLLTAATLGLTLANSSFGGQKGTGEQDYDVTLLCSFCGHLDKAPASRVRADFDAIRQAPYLPEVNSTELTSPIRKGLACAKCGRPSNFPNPIHCQRCRKYYHPLPMFSGIFDLVCPHCQYPLPAK